MQLFRYATSIYGGSDVVIGASWDLLPWFVAIGVAFICRACGGEGLSRATQSRELITIIR